jgi:SWI/SNF-related matrix-associated actin-dependent regulator of chromatin subfamily A3
MLTCTVRGFRGYSLEMCVFTVSSRHINYHYHLHRMLKICGPSDKRDQLEPLLIWATPGQRGFPANTGAATISNNASGSSYASSGASGPYARETKGMTAAQKEAAKKQQEALQKAAELKQMLSSLERVDDEGRRNSLLDTLCATDDILNLPLHPNPPGVASGELIVDLMKHQVRCCLFFILT